MSIVVKHHIENVYMIGIGGIGMSALARYFLNQGIAVSGYDRSPSSLTSSLVEEGCTIHFKDDPGLIDARFRNPLKTLVIFTPAVPYAHAELSWFRKREFRIMKRAQVLGMITRDQKTIAVAGTHGKTTVSSILAHILHHSGTGCNAFLGGIMKNYHSNVLLSETDSIFVVEADEFDRSFLQLNPWLGLITSCDPDHLDIYGDHSSLKGAFSEFASRVQPGGHLLMHSRVDIPVNLKEGVRVFRYSLEEQADFRVSGLRNYQGRQQFELEFPDCQLRGVSTGVPGKLNVENSLAAASAAWLAGVKPDEIADALATCKGVKRRFDIQIQSNDLVYIDDYAHHPREITALVASVRHLFPGKKLTGIFQPHLYSRTRDFAQGFANSLDTLDEVFMLDIYPAREEPIPGVSAEMILEKMQLKNKQMCSKEGLIERLSGGSYEVLISMGAGDIDRMVDAISQLFGRKNEADE